MITFKEFVLNEENTGNVDPKEEGSTAWKKLKRGLKRIADLQNDPDFNKPAQKPRLRRKVRSDRKRPILRRKRSLDEARSDPQKVGSSAWKKIQKQLAKISALEADPNSDFNKPVINKRKPSGRIGKTNNPTGISGPRPERGYAAYDRTIETKSKHRERLRREAEKAKKT